MTFVGSRQSKLYVLDILTGKVVQEYGGDDGFNDLVSKDQAEAILRKGGGLLLVSRTEWHLKIYDFGRVGPDNWKQGRRYFFL